MGDESCNRLERNYVTLDGYIMDDDVESLSCFLSKDDFPYSSDGMRFFKTSMSEESYKCAIYILDLYDLDIVAKDICKNKEFEYRVNNILRSKKIKKLLNGIHKNK